MPAINTTAINTTVAANALLTKRTNFYGMIPNIGFNAAMLAIWSVILAIQTLQLCMKQYWFSVGMICGGILEVLGYVGRTWSHYNTSATTAFLLNMVCLTISPVFILGALYYQLSKLIEIYGHKFCLLRPSILYAYAFICCDIISLAIQASGGGIAGEESAQGEHIAPGTHVFVAGLSFQVATLSIFILLMADFIFKVYVQTRWRYMGYVSFSPKILKVSQKDLEPMYRDRYHDLRMEPDRWVFHYFIHALVAAILLIFVRCSYRLAEMVHGFTSYLAVHENYFIILDGVMLSLAVTIMTIFHPGFAFKGRTVPIIVTSGKTDDAIVDMNNMNTGGDALDIVPQPSSEQDEDTVSEDERFYSNEKSIKSVKSHTETKGPKRAISLPSLSGRTFTSRISLKRVTNQFSIRGGTKKTLGTQSSAVSDASTEVYQSELPEEPDVPDSLDKPPSFKEYESDLPEEPPSFRDSVVSSVPFDESFADRIV